MQNRVKCSQAHTTDFVMDKKELKILIVDDDEITRNVITSLLSKEGYSVASANDGLDAIKILRAEEITLIITDISTPRADGIEVVKHAMRNNPDVAVVMLTSYGTLNTALAAIKEGAYDYLTKPFKIEEILILVERVHERALLINEKQELANHLRDTYRDIDLINNVAVSNNPEIITNWLERIERLKATNVLTIEEADILKERIIRGNGKRKDINN